jgi:hypothetical protein
LTSPCESGVFKPLPLVDLQPTLFPVIKSY